MTWGRPTTARSVGGTERPPAEPGNAEPIDVERLRELDRTMRAVPGFRRPWVQYRKTLVFERVAWFREPRVFSTRRADEFFTQEAVLAGRLDLAFFGQVPSLTTGLGLLLTFVAICVGLSRLHADGQTIDGIQGLINGLSGKFLTSIVGLVCANLFVLLERPALRRLLDAHAEFLALLDESFPRRTVEELLDGLGRLRAPREADDGVQRLEDAVEALTEAVRELSARIPRSEP